MGQLKQTNDLRHAVRETFARYCSSSAWIWQRYQPGSAIVGWFRSRAGGAARRLRKVMVVALARKLLIALWRFATQGVVPERAVLAPTP